MRNKFYRKKTCIHCSTKEEAEILLKCTSSLKSLKQKSTTSALDWKSYKENTCFDLYGETFGNIKFYKAIGYKILELSDYIKK
jgi:hypothetical protein